jgi:hypothetical protein
MVTGNNSVRTMSESFVPVLTKYDESLTEDIAGDCCLYIQLSSESLCFTILHPLRNKYLSIESVDFGKFLSAESFATVLTTYIQNHPWLTLPFKEIVIYYEATETTLVPSPLFAKEENGNFAHFNFDPAPNQQVLSDKIQNLDTYIVYAVPKVFLNLFKEVLSTHALVCHAGRFIDLVLITNKKTPIQKKIFLNVRRSFVDIAIPEGNKLLFFNSFEFRTREDFLYYLIFVMEQLAIHPEETELLLSGFIEKNSPMFDIFFKYVKNIRFVSKSDAFKYSYLLDEIPDHYFYNLLNGRLCE